jgi:hypothetical protein
MKVEVATVGSAELSNAVVAPKPAEPEPRAAPGKFEIRNKSEFPMLKIKRSHSSSVFRDFCRLGDLSLFRISDLVLRILNLAHSARDFADK